MIKAIVFDCFGVLTTDVWREFLDNLPSDIDTELPRKLNKQYDMGKINQQEFLAKIKLATGFVPLQVEDLNTSDVLKNTALLKYIKQLKTQYKISLLSNIASNWISESFLSTDEIALFDDIIFSHNVKMAKPNPEIFKLACSNLSVLPNETIMVDDIESNITAAVDIGMKGVVYKDFKQFERQLRTLLNHL